MKRLTLIAVLILMHPALFAQVQNGVITGRLRGIDGQPVRVAVASLNANGQITADTLVGITMTDASGNYRIENVPPGRYGIIAGAVGSPTFYPGVTNSSEATLVVIAPGSMTAELNFALVTSPIPRQAENFEDARKLALQQKFQGPQQRGLIMLSGRVVVEGGTTPSDLSNLTLIFRRNVNAAPTVDLATIRTDGSFGLEVEPDEYTVSLGRRDGKPLDGYVVRSIQLGFTDLLRVKLKANGGMLPGNIVVTLVPLRIAAHAL